MQETTITPAKANVSLFDKVSEFDHEAVLFCNDNATGLKAIIAVHNTTLGPGLGGIRMWPYKSDEEALVDVLRLSRGMTLKASVAGLNQGGGKAVIIGDARTQKSEAFLRRFGMFIDNLGGKYIAAEDVGMSEQDMEFIRMETRHVTGLPEVMGGSGDPSPVTAYGVYMGMKAAMKHASGSDSLEGKRVMVQGIGTVGRALVDLLEKENAEIFVYDIYEPALQEVTSATRAQVVTAEQVYALPVDIYAPCALGGTLNPDTIPQLNCSVVAGAANNQLLEEKRDGLALQKRNILYAPDFVINSGGIINISLEMDGFGYNLQRALHLTQKVYDTTLKVWERAASEGVTPHQAAFNMAKERIQRIGQNRLFH